MCSRNNFCTQNYTHFENELFILNETLDTKLTIPECDDLIPLFVIFLILATFIYLSCKYIIKTILDENKKYSTHLVNSVESKQSIQIQTIRQEFRSELEKTTSQFKKIDDDICKLKAQFQECYDQNQNILSQLDSTRGELTD
jgi:TolA-binding protein